MKKLKDDYNLKQQVYNECSSRRSASGKLFDNLPELIRPRELSRILGISIATVYDWKYRGRTRDVPINLFLKINRTLFIRTEVLKNWISLQN